MTTMSWALGWLSRGRQSAAPRERGDEPQSRFRYLRDLIPVFQADHAGLLKQCRAIEKMVATGDFSGIPLALSAFKARLEVHLLNESLHLFCYLDERLPLDAAERVMIREIRAETTGTSRDVINLIKQYRAAGITPANSSMFLAEWKPAATALLQQLAREEQDLYPLYQP
jgi:hypothetical protein